MAVDHLSVAILYYFISNKNLSKYNFNLGNTTANNHKNIDRIATFSGGTWVSKDYNADFGGQWCLVDSFLINDNGAMQRIMSTQTNTVLATRYCEKNVWGDWDIGVTKSDLEKQASFEPYVLNTNVSEYIKSLSAGKVHFFKTSSGTSGNPYTSGSCFYMVYIIDTSHNGIGLALNHSTTAYFMRISLGDVVYIKLSA